MNNIFFNLLKNMYTISKLPVPRYTWVIETKILELDCELETFISKYNKNGNYYNKLLSDIPGLNILTRIEDCYPVYWAYTVLVEERDALIRKLNEKGILSMQIHPRNDKWTIFKDSMKELPGVDYFNERELSLPCGWWVDKIDIEWISSIIKEGW